MIKRSHTVIVVLLLSLLVPVFAHAIEPQHAKQLTMARRYLGEGMTEEAYSILDNLLKLYPSEPRMLNEIYKLYKDNKDYERALELLNHRRMVFPRDKSLTLEKGSLFLRMGEDDSAAVAYDKYLKRMGHSQAGYKNVSRAYQLNGYYRQATETFLAGRKQIGDSSMFAQQLGWLYRQRRNHKDATLEFYKFMTADTANLRHGISDIRSLISYLDDYSELKDAFQQIIENNPDDFHAHDFYAEIHLRNGHLDSAFEAVKIADSLDEKDGRHLLSFANNCLMQNRFRMAERTCRHILDNYDNPQSKGMAEIHLAQAYLNLERPDSAIMIYHSIIEKTSFNQPRWFDGIYLLGSTFLEHLYQTDSARYYFNQLIEKDRTMRWADRARMKIADSYIIDNQLERADSLYLAVNTNRLERAEKEELVFKRAQIKFFQKEYDQAKGLYQHLSGIYPRSLYVNDCLRKILIIDENQGMAILDLNFYSQAERMVWQNKIDSALARLVELSERGNSNLAALATFEAGKIYYDRGDYEKSFEMFTRMLESFEESFYSAESQRYIGDLYFYHFDNKQKAAEAYRLILENYPNRVLYEYARRQLRKLES